LEGGTFDSAYKLVHVGPEPMPASDGWVCAFSPADGNPRVLDALRAVYKAARALERVGLP
jgi:hypothetical protein